jgi:hypothetical protein
MRALQTNRRRALNLEYEMIEFTKRKSTAQPTGDYFKQFLVFDKKEA